MSFLFKSKKERAREVRKERRRALRQAEGTTQKVEDRIKSMDRDAKKDWDKAKESLLSGQEVSARRYLTSYRAAQVLITKLEQKKWVFKQYLMKLETAGSDAEFASALAAVNAVTNINPDMVEDIFEEASELLGEQQDADSFWKSAYEGEIGGAENAMDEYIPSIEELTAELKGEAAEAVGETSKNLEPEMKKRISEGRERVKKLLDD